MVCEAPISIEKQTNLLGALRGSLGPLLQHHRPQLATPALAALKVWIQERKGQLHHTTVLARFLYLFKKKQKQNLFLPS